MGALMLWARFRCREIGAGCRVVPRPYNRGLSVRPFKPQNMSNNAAVTVDGGEIGRAQALQALACRVEPHTDMNPVLLKPQADHTSQLVVHGKVRGTLGGGNFRHKRGELLPEVMESWHRLQAQCDVVELAPAAGGDQPAGRRHRQHGLCPCCRCASRAGRRYRSRRRHCCIAGTRAY